MGGRSTGKKLRNVALAFLDSGGGDCPVLPCNWGAARLFNAVQAQWRYGRSGRIIGLDYAAVQAAAAGMAIEWVDAFPAIRIMESATLDIARNEG